MDLRESVVAVLAGGACAPGINGVISSVTLEALNQGLAVVGVFDGFSEIREGVGEVQALSLPMVTKIFDKGGCIVRTNRAQLDTELHVDNALRVLEFHRVRFLVTVGGVNTAMSAAKLAMAAQKRKMNLSIVHVPKTIFNDLPLPEDSHTFGYSTAREVGSNIVKNFQMDSRTMQKWYVLVVLGRQAGHLALGIGKATAATLTIIREDFGDRTIKFSELLDHIETTVYKRRAAGKKYGVVIVQEGVGAVIDKDDIKSIFGSLNVCYEELGTEVVKALRKRFAERKLEVEINSRHIGSELRSAAPDSLDTTLTRDLGFAAVRYLLRGGNGDIICKKEGGIVPMALVDALDLTTKAPKIRSVNRSKLNYRVARHYMIKLDREDLSNVSKLSEIAQAAGLAPEEFAARYSYLVGDEQHAYSKVLDNPDVTWKGLRDRYPSNASAHSRQTSVSITPQPDKDNDLFSEAPSDHIGDITFA